ncbi:MAG: GGDEF domain-containing protein [Rhodobacterales bacterium CG2_30_65_12]|nr:MAG: GGDEF domain-containing protein [Rhodobacterales bacterium CG2_30_65_12]
MTPHPQLPPGSISLAPEALNRLLPMHVLVDGKGIIAHAGPTVAKIHPGQGLIGRRFFDVFAPRRPRHTEDLEEICFLAGGKFTLRMCDAASTPLIATAVCPASGAGVLVNLSFGIAVVEAVARFRLAGSDFAATDLTLEMLYLVEANAAAMAESRMLNERLHGAKIEAEAEALSDMLTGLQNRRALDQMLSRMIARGMPFTLMHLDLDFFKQVNDTLGHAAGDLVLKEVARILLDETRDEDVVARVGGDEFVIIANGLTDYSRLRAIAGRLIRRLEEPVPYGDCAARISASIGMAVSTHYTAVDAATLMHDADVALYASKARGRACFSFHAPGMEEPEEAVSDVSLV